MSTNFVKQTPQPKKVKPIKKKSKKKKTIVSIIIVIIVLLIVMVLINIPAGKSLYSNAMNGKNNFLAAQKSVEEQNFSQATERLELARQDFLAANEAYEKLNEFKYIPFARRQMLAVENLLIVGIQLSSAISKVTQLGDEIITMIEVDENISFNQISEEQKKDILQKLYQSPPELQAVKAEIDLAAYAIDQIPKKGLLGPLKRAIQPIKDDFPTIKQLVDKIVPIIEILPQVSGYPEEKTYLFLLQNNAELRPTGGFIGTYGIIKVKNAEVKYFETDNIYNLDNIGKDYLFIDPPWQYQKYMGSTQWLMRDSNWSPNFPEAAEKALWFYEQEGGEEKNIDGVIAVTPEFIKDLIKVVGSVTVDGIEFTPENFTEIIQYEVEQAFVAKGISDAERKKIIGKIGSQLLEDLLALPKDSWQLLWAEYIDNVSEKHILLYMTDPELQQTALEQNWAGEIVQTNSDYLYIVDCNLASLKTDPGVIRTITYNVERDSNNDLIADLNIHYKNEGTFNWKSTRYRTYTRIIVPMGSELLEYDGVMENDKLHGGGAGQVETTQEWNKTVFGGFISVEPKQEGSLHYKYKLPSTVEENGYELYIQKQGGTNNHNLNINLNLGQKINNINSIDNFTKRGDNTVTFEGQLDSDKQAIIDTN